METNILLETLANQFGLEAQLPNDQEDMIHELQANTASNSSVCASDARGPVEESRIAVFDRSGRFAQDVE